MKKLLLTKLALLLVMLVGVGSVWAEDFTLSSDADVTQNGITVSFAKGSGSTAPTWYTAGLRLYANNTITISSTNTITSITFDWEKQGSKAFNTATASVGTYTHPSAAGKGTWTGSANEIVFTIGSSGQLQLNTLSVTTNSGSVTPTCATPTFSPAAGAVVSGTEVSISSTEGATIYYTLDGTEPTTSSSVYSAPIEITAATTIKAFATKSDYSDSEVATAVYTIKKAVSGYTIDFENDVEDYVDWTFSNIGTSNTEIEAHSGSKYGANINETGNGVASASIETKEKIASPGTFTCYISKTSKNTTSSSWILAVSTNGTVWTEVDTKDATVMSKGEWQEFTADLSSYYDVYVRLSYGGSTAIRAIDDISITMNTSSTPVITASDITIDYNATSGEIAYSVAHPTTGETLSATTEADWISNISVDADKVTFTATENEGGSDRTAKITLSYTGATDKVVNVTQGHPVVDYATLPFAFDGKKNAISETEGLSQNGLADYNTKPYLKFDGTGDNLILKINENPGILSFDIKGNTFEGGTFTVQISTDGETYTDLTKYTGLSDTQTDNFVLPTDVRYIKWIYTEKETGNVGLGNIKLSKEVKVTSNGWATYIAPCKMKFEAGNAYIVIAASVADGLTLTEVTEVDTGEPILLKGEGTKTPKILAKATEFADNGNLLSVCNGTIESGKFPYVLAKEGAGAAFKRWTGEASVLNGRVVLLLDEAVSAARSIFMLDGDNTTTGIAQIENEASKMEGSVYNLNGQRVNSPKKGLYIVNGKKVMMK